MSEGSLRLVDGRMVVKLGETATQVQLLDVATREQFNVTKKKFADAPDRVRIATFVRPTAYDQRRR